MIKKLNIDIIPMIYKLNGTLLAEVSSIRVLAVTIDVAVNFWEHIDVIVKKGSQLSGFDRCLLECCCPVWHLGYKAN